MRADLTLLTLLLLSATTCFSQPSDLGSEKIEIDGHTPKAAKRTTATNTKTVVSDADEMPEAEGSEGEGPDAVGMVPPPLVRKHLPSAYQQGAPADCDENIPAAPKSVSHIRAAKPTTPLSELPPGATTAKPIPQESQEIVPTPEMLNTDDLVPNPSAVPKPRKDKKKISPQENVKGNTRPQQEEDDDTTANTAPVPKPDRFSAPVVPAPVVKPAAPKNAMKAEAEAESKIASPTELDQDDESPLNEEDVDLEALKNDAENNDEEDEGVDVPALAGLKADAIGVPTGHPEPGSAGLGELELPFYFFGHPRPHHDDGQNNAAEPPAPPPQPQPQLPAQPPPLHRIQEASVKVEPKPVEIYGDPEPLVPETPCQPDLVRTDTELMPETSFLPAGSRSVTTRAATVTRKQPQVEGEWAPPAADSATDSPDTRDAMDQSKWKAYGMVRGRGAEEALMGSPPALHELDARQRNAHSKADHILAFKDNLAATTPDPDDIHDIHPDTAWAFMNQSPERRNAAQFDPSLIEKERAEAERALAKQEEELQKEFVPLSASPTRSPTMSPSVSPSMSPSPTPPPLPKYPYFTITQPRNTTNNHTMNATHHHNHEAPTSGTRVGVSVPERKKVPFVREGRMANVRKLVNETVNGTARMRRAGISDVVGDNGLLPALQVAESPDREEPAVNRPAPHGIVDMTEVMTQVERDTHEMKLDVQEDDVFVPETLVEETPVVVEPPAVKPKANTTTKTQTNNQQADQVVEEQQQPTQTSSQQEEEAQNNDDENAGTISTPVDQPTAFQNLRDAMGDLVRPGGFQPYLSRDNMMGNTGAFRSNLPRFGEAMGDVQNNAGFGLGNNNGFGFGTPNFAWNFGGLPSGPEVSPMRMPDIVCQSRRTCDSCVSNENCVWCPVMLTCTSGDSTGPDSATACQIFAHGTCDAVSVIGS